jgi:hypothetical protein
VRMRSRKPWVFARRRLFGWKVRLLTSKLRLRALSRGHQLQDATLAERGEATVRAYAVAAGRSTIGRGGSWEVGPDCTYAAGKDSLSAQTDAN